MPIRYNTGDVVNGWIIVSRGPGVRATIKCPHCSKIFDVSSISAVKRKSKPSKPCHHYEFNDGNIPPRKRLYRIFHGMKSRCYKPSDKCYHIYGGKGVKICDEWLKKKGSFYEWALSHGYSNSLTIDRIDSAGDYCPENCRWISMQDNSKRANNRVFYTIDGVSDTGAGWSTRLHIGINHISSFARTHTKEEVEKYIQDLLAGSVETPEEPPLLLFTVNGITDTSKGWGNRLGIHPYYLHSYKSYNGVEATEKRISEILSGCDPRKGSFMIKAYGVVLSATKWSTLFGLNDAAFSIYRHDYGLRKAVRWLKDRAKKLPLEKIASLNMDFSDEEVSFYAFGKYRDINVCGVVLKQIEWEPIFHLSSGSLAQKRKHTGYAKFIKYMEETFQALPEEEKEAARKQQGKFSFYNVWPDRDKKKKNRGK